MKVPRSLRTVLALLTLLALVVTGCGGARSLALRIKQGEQVGYHMVMDMDMTMTMSADGQTFPDTKATTHLEYDATLLFEQVTAEEATATYQFSNYTGYIETAGQKQPLANLPADFKVTMTMNPKTGELIDITGLPGVGDSAGLSKDQFKDLLKDSVTKLPASGQARVGDSWENVINPPFNLPGLTGNSSLKTTTRYEANETRDGVEVARLITTGNGPLNLTLNEDGTKLTMQGSLESNGTSYVDLKTGLPHSMDSTGTVKIESDSTEQNGPPVHMTVETMVHMVMTRN